MQSAIRKGRHLQSRSLYHDRVFTNALFNTVLDNRTQCTLFNTTTFIINIQAYFYDNDKNKVLLD